MKAVIWAGSLHIRLTEDTATLTATLHMFALARVLVNFSVLTSTLGVNFVCNIGFGLDSMHSSTDGLMSHMQKHSYKK